jgi:hypothetical protein
MFEGTVDLEEARNKLTGNGGVAARCRLTSSPAFRGEEDGLLGLENRRGRLHVLKSTPTRSVCGSLLRELGFIGWIASVAHYPGFCDS